MKVGFGWGLSVVAVFLSIIAPFAVVLESVEAQTPFNQGFFTGRPITAQRFNVIDGGVPATVTTKAQFIAFIEGILARGRGTPQADRDYVGASFVVQTMRGGTDRTFPDAADLQEWRNRINNPAITINWGFFNAGINSGRLNFSVPSRDAAQYYGDGNQYRSLLFYHNGSLVYAIKQVCANPLGNLPGLPTPPPVSNFNLNPTVNGTPNFGEPGSSTNLTPTINNTGTTPSTSAAWQLNRFTVPAGQPLPSGAVNGTNPTTHYGYGATTIDSGNQVFQRNSTNVAEGNRTLPDEPVDTRICFALSVRPASQSNGNWRHSNPFCVTIAKAPKVQVLGGDIVAGRAGTGDIVTSAITKSVSGQNRTYGSWGEYAVSATGIVRGMASGAGYSGGRVNSTVCNVAYLTISNAGTSTCTNATVFGGYANLPSLPAVTTRFNPTATAGATVNLSTAPNRTIYRGSGTIQVSASSAIGAGRWIVINAPTANVTITSNIRYTTGNLTSVSQIPQIVIIANNISISPSVTQVDAWLMATGTSGRITTCNQVANATALRSTNCTNPLTINGPVAARTLNLWRTAGSGSGAASGDPAEVINLRPDAFLWATSYSADAGRVPTVSTKELPPRF